MHIGEELRIAVRVGDRHAGGLRDMKHLVRRIQRDAGEIDCGSGRRAGGSDPSVSKVTDGPPALFGNVRGMAASLATENNSNNDTSVTRSAISCPDGRIKVSVDSLKIPIGERFLAGNRATLNEGEWVCCVHIRSRGRWVVGTKRSARNVPRSDDPLRFQVLQQLVVQ
jgi:hypothetical protein